jgi:hypothetical protein
MSFDLAIVDSDHSRLSVYKDVQGILPHAKVLLMHDSYNPKCRKGMLDALKHQQIHAYLMDFIPATLKDDGLWGDFAIAWQSDKQGPVREFKGELSSFSVMSFISLFHLKSKFYSLKVLITQKLQEVISQLRIISGKIFEV